MSSFYITTPIYYVNANPHLGHAYTTIVADAAARLHKLQGDATLLLTGTDEHGDKIVRAAEKNNISPKDFVDQISNNFRRIWPRLSIREDHFTRTTDAAHVNAVQDFLQKIYDAGDIYFGEFGGHYCYGCERFYTDKELENGLCPQHLTKPEYISEKNYFFRMSKYLPWLQSYLEENPGMIRPERYLKEAMAMLEGGVLEDLCISRPKTRLQWGIELPFDHDYVCYVWFDALISYLSGLDWPDGAEFKKFWPGCHLVAKDILKPHAIFWPCMLKAAGIPVYKNLYVHGYWLSRDTKMSKSLGNVIEPLEQAQKYGLDAFRYFLLRDMHFGSDASFSEEAIVSRINSDLANDLGNLFSRVLSMNGKYFAGTMHEAGEAAPEDQAILDLCSNSLQNYLQIADNMEFARALEALWEFVRALNKYVDSQAPWKLFKEEKISRLAQVMNLLLSSLRKIAIFLWPVMPDASCKMLEQLGEAELADKAAKGLAPVNNILDEAKTFRYLPAGQKTAVASNIFPRIATENSEAKISEKSIKDKEKNLSQNSEIAKKTAPATVSFEAFKSLDLRVGTIIDAQKHPNADRILVIKADFGENEPRQILSGLAEFYDPADLVGQKVCAVLNLEPRKIRGLVSCGMILTVEDGDKVTLLQSGKDACNGSIIC